MPLIEVTLAEGRSPEKLRALISKLTEAVVETDVAKKEAVRVILREVPKSHWAAGDETLADRTVGLLGFGRIGRTIAEMLVPFGARVLVHDPYVPASAIRRAGATPASWRQLLRAPFLVLAAGLTDRTRGLLDAAALARLPDGAVVVNVARGALLSLEALTREVRRGRLRCALDVTDPDEPLPARHPLRRARGAVVTPHVGAAQGGVRRQMAAIVTEDLERFFAGRPVRNRVTPSMLRRMT